MASKTSRGAPSLREPKAANAIKIAATSCRSASAWLAKHGPNDPGCPNAASNSARLIGPESIRQNKIQTDQQRNMMLFQVPVANGFQTRIRKGLSSLLEMRCGPIGQRVLF